MKIFLCGNARMVVEPEIERQLLFAKVIGLVDFDLYNENRYGWTGQKAVVQGTSDELWIIDKIADSIILDDHDLPIMRGTDAWETCCSDMRKYGIEYLRYEELL